MKRILIVGATSAIATACARLWAAEGAELFLVARNAERLAETVADLTPRGAAAVHGFELDVNDVHRHADMLEACAAALQQIDIVLIAHGTLPDQAACEADTELMLAEFATNAGATLALLNRLAARLEMQRCGTLAVISSVAGDRGRASNYVYGSAKAAVTACCEGLRARLFRHGVHVVTIKPGFVDTPMTRDLPLPRPLVISAEQAAARIVAGIARRRAVLYVPAFWAAIMFVIRSLPQPIFKRLRL
ncbi:SDR family oxidoreductase [Pseudazoarcus pumilus]|uniref:Short-chain dehydrogenase n=1 Tax=Pseudazoarcus pumilus TaxID=2067960 RepID=A0A2I6S518_9RHOO|nr:SDR family oxidoreductase [Pseudazoarcus pumilus]AUN94348.1 short-chain dehydrogenase [Pseudazoarcus pumilus]